MKLSPSLLNHFAVLFMKLCIVIGVLTFALLSFGCSDQNHPLGDPKPILNRTLIDILPNQTWNERLGGPEISFATQFRDNAPLNTEHTVWTLDLGAGETEWNTNGESWALEGDTILNVFKTNPGGSVYDLVRFEVKGYNYDTVWIKPTWQGGTDRVLVRG